MKIRNYKSIILFIFLIAIAAIFACGDDDSPTETTNHPPYQPYSPSPINGSSNRSVDSDLSWSCEDPDENPLTYTLYFSETETLNVLLADLDTAFYALGTLENNESYYWKVVAYDNQGDSTEGAIWSFSTAPGSNSAPNTPGNPSPAGGATGQATNVNLSWSCTDPDYGDYLNYNIYFDTATVPSIAATALSSASYDPGELLPSTWYRWRVVAYDNYNDSTSGPVWSFQTGGEAEGVFAAMAIARTIVPVDDNGFFRMDEIVARFDSAYAPCDPITPLEAEDVSCNEYLLSWNAALGLHKYSDMVNFSFLDLGESYTFEISGSIIVPALTDSIDFPDTETYITSPELNDTLSINGFTVSWAGVGTDSVYIMLLSGDDTTAVSVLTDNDGSHTFSGDDLESLGGQAGEYGLMLIYQKENLIDATGYDSRSYIWARIINVVTVRLQ